MALIMLLWIAPSLPTTRVRRSDPAARARGDQRARADHPVGRITHATWCPRCCREPWRKAASRSAGSSPATTRSSSSMPSRPIWRAVAGIELTYRDTDGHAVTYVILPAGPVVIPERGRVQIDRWRPLVRTEAGFSFIIWKQQNLLCLLVSDLVSDGRPREAQAILRQGAFVHRALPGLLDRSPRHSAPRSRGARIVRSTTNGSAMTVQATSTTSVSPKLYSARPPTRNPVTAARLPATSARARPASAGKRRRTASARV